MDAEVYPATKGYTLDSLPVLQGHTEMNNTHIYTKGTL